MSAPTKKGMVAVVRTNYFRALTILFAMMAAAIVAVLLSYGSASGQTCDVGCEPPPPGTVAVSDVFPNGGSTNVDVDANITATFDQAMTEASINDSTFYLKKKGSKKKVPAETNFDPTTRTVTLNPESSLRSNTTYTAYVKGGKEGVKGDDGEKLGGTTDPTATFKRGKVRWSFTTEEDCPQCNPA